MQSTRKAQHQDFTWSRFGFICFACAVSHEWAAIASPLEMTRALEQMRGAIGRAQAL